MEILVEMGTSGFFCTGKSRSWPLLGRRSRSGWGNEKNSSKKMRLDV